MLISSHILINTNLDMFYSITKSCFYFIRILRILSYQSIGKAQKTNRKKKINNKKCYLLQLWLALKGLLSDQIWLLKFTSLSSFSCTKQAVRARYNNLKIILKIYLYLYQKKVTVNFENGSIKIFLSSKSSSCIVHLTEPLNSR